MRAADTLSSAELEWSRNTRGVATRLGRLTLPERARGAADLTALRAQIDVMRATCGWPSP